MTNTRIQLKNVKYFESLSEETNAYSADIYFDGKKIGLCSNRGHGGETNICGISEGSYESIKLARKYCSSLPPLKYEDFEFPSSFESVCDTLFEKWLGEKESKKLEKKFDKSILYGNNYSYRESSFTRGGKNIPLKELFNNTQGIEYVKSFCLAKIKEGHKILNTNLPFELTY